MGIVGDIGDGVVYGLEFSRNSYHGMLIDRGVMVGIKDGGLGGRRDILFFNDGGGGYGVNNKFYHLYLVDEMAEVFVGDYYLDFNGHVKRCYNYNVHILDSLNCRKIVGSTDNLLEGLLVISDEFVSYFIDCYNNGILLELVGGGVLGNSFNKL